MLTAEVASFVTQVTGVQVSPEDLRQPRQGGQLSLNAFVRLNASQAAALLASALPACPSLARVEEKNGWLLFYLSHEWFNRLLSLSRALPLRPPVGYVENRMAILSRKPGDDCPPVPQVQAALWTAYLCYRRGSWRPMDEGAVLTMTHGCQGQARLALENRCGAVADAIRRLKGASRP